MGQIGDGLLPFLIAFAAFAPLCFIMGTVNHNKKWRLRERDNSVRVFLEEIERFGDVQ